MKRFLKGLILGVGIVFFVFTGPACFNYEDDCHDCSNECYNHCDACNTCDSACYDSCNDCCD